MQLADRMLVSRETAQLEMGLDPEAELEKLKKERDLREQEGIGLLGSPAQQSPRATPSNTGTPSTDGRPKGQPSGKKNPVDQTKTVKRRSTPPPASQQPQNRASLLQNIEDKLRSLSSEDKSKILGMLTK
jgi:hypothetical protein